ncbi:MAG: hypothetical protein PHU23_13185, partial [Dehalococcoidales bacterium]|nr:hypothetical protein [Dehalococcoidales bacterium]
MAVKETQGKTDWGTVAVVAGGVALLGGGLYYWLRSKNTPGVPTGLHITSYKNMRTGVTANLPDQLNVIPGDTIRVSFEYSYFGPAISGVYHVATWYQWLDPHDELDAVDVPFTLNNTANPSVIKASVDIKFDLYEIGLSTYGLLVKIAGIAGKDYVAYANDVLYRQASGQLVSITKPTATPSEVMPGETVSLAAKVKSLNTQSMSVIVKFNIYEGSVLPGAGTLLKTISSPVTNLAAGAELTFTTNYVADKRSDTRRDVGIEVWEGGTKIEDGQWDDIFFVKDPQVSFTLGKPTASPYEAPPGPVTINAPVTSASTLTQNVTVKCNIYEGSILPGAGTLIETLSKSITIAPNQTVTVSFNHTSTLRPDTRRDVGIEVWVGGTKVKDGQWDDIFFVAEWPIVILLDPPTATPYEAPPGPVIIDAPILLSGDTSRSVSIKCTVYEGSILPGAGDVLWSVNVTRTLQPGMNHIQFEHNSTARSETRRDVGIEVTYQGEVKASDQWDDVFYVTETNPTEQEFQNIRVTSIIPTETWIGFSVLIVGEFDYRGPNGTIPIRACIGNQHTVPVRWFDEILYTQENIPVWAGEWHKETFVISVDITSQISPGWYDVYAKFAVAFPENSPVLENVLRIRG